ncbi:MAG: hypothetical protein RDO_1370 [Flavobacteriales endosymbiont of Rhyzopertha dominica]|nr:MAG: hypothetical protein NHG05_00490 [Candidatus Shikimatogenerans bostrichidophilus]
MYNFLNYKIKNSFFELNITVLVEKLLENLRNFIKFKEELSFMKFIRLSIKFFYYL